MGAGRPNDKLMKEMKKRPDRSSSIRQIRPWTRNSQAIPQLPAGQRLPSDLYLSTARDVTETSVISTLWRLWPGGAHVGYGSVLSLHSEERTAADVKDIGSQISGKQHRNIEDKEHGRGKKKQGRDRTAKACIGMRAEDKMEKWRKGIFE